MISEVTEMLYKVHFGEKKTHSKEVKEPWTDAGILDF